MRIANLGHLLFAITLIGIGLWGLASGDFGAIWQPVPKSWPARHALAYLCALVALGAGAGLLWRRSAPAAAGALTLWLLGWSLAIKAPVVIRTPVDAAAWESWGETLVLAAAAWVLFSTFTAGRGAVSGAGGLRLARWLYGLAMIAFGVAHFAYLRLTASLIPAWLPAHAPLVGITGAAYVAAGLAILSGVLAPLAAALSAAQMGVFTLLVWAPVAVKRDASADDWGEFVVSWSLTMAGWVIAASYRRKPPPETPSERS